MLGPSTRGRNQCLHLASSRSRTNDEQDVRDHLVVFERHLGGGGRLWSSSSSCGVVVGPSLAYSEVGRKRVFDCASAKTAATSARKDIDGARDLNADLLHSKRKVALNPAMEEKGIHCYDNWILIRRLPQWPDILRSTKLLLLKPLVPDAHKPSQDSPLKLLSNLEVPKHRNTSAKCGRKSKIHSPLITHASLVPLSCYRPLHLLPVRAPSQSNTQSYSLSDLTPFDRTRSEKDAVA